MLHALADPWSQDFLQRALLELALVGDRGGALGCWVVFYELSYSAESLAHALFPGLVVAALARRAAARSAARPACSSRPARSPSSAGRRRSGATRRSRSWSRPVRPRRRCSRSRRRRRPGLERAPLRRRARGHGHRPRRAGRARRAACSARSRCSTGSCSSSASTAASARAFGARPLRVDLALLGLDRGGRARRRAGAREPARRRGDRRPGGDRAPAHAAARADDGARVRASRVAAAVAGLYLSYYADLAAGASVALAIVAGYLARARWTARSAPPASSARCPGRRGSRGPCTRAGARSACASASTLSIDARVARDRGAASGGAARGRLDERARRQRPRRADDEVAAAPARASAVPGRPRAPRRPGSASSSRAA